VWFDVKLGAIAVAGVTAIAGLSLVGAGVSGHGERPSPHESFSSQDPNLVLSASGATGNGTSSIVLAPLGSTGSSFMTAQTPITIMNNGHSTATTFALQLSDQSNNASLRGATWVCLVSNGRVFFNEPVTTVEGYGWAEIPHLSLAPGATDIYTVVYYAGTNENTGCGSAFTGYMAVRIDGYPGQYGATEPYPAGTTNPVAVSLTNPAEGGTLSVTVTINAGASTESKSSGDEDGDQRSGGSNNAGDEDEAQQSGGSHNSGDHYKGHH
jgi:hypothetical protein